MTKLSLGQKTDYTGFYDSSLLYAINRTHARKQIGVTKPLPFTGFDIWNCYEFSWLSATGKPELRILTWAVEADSEHIVESKSVKLYLNSFHNTKFPDEDEVFKIIKADLEATVKSQVFLKVKTLTSIVSEQLASFTGICLDTIPVTIVNFELNKQLLKLSETKQEVAETLYSNLFKTNCLITGQPDWGSIQINYVGQKIAHESILKYLIAFRNHNEFAEPACERIFTDLMNVCQPQKLTVYIRFTRRGGIDINPIRSTELTELVNVNNLRHTRQ